VILSPDGQTTIPVTLRTLVPTGPNGGTFSGVLTGGNGNFAPAQSNTYDFNVPSGQTDLDASVTLADDPGDQLIGYLVDPNGQTVGSSSNYTTDNSGNQTATRWVTMYHVAPQPGPWRLVLDWVNPVTGNELNEPFSGAIQFNQVRAHANLPASA
jgi:hypothetical protein